MGRMDVQSLNVPADFAAIFDKQTAPSIDPPTALPAVQLPRVNVNPEHCSKCSSRLSAVEAKMGRCLTCGTSLSASSNIKVGI
jgi:hypothetical protein